MSNEVDSSSTHGSIEELKESYKQGKIARRECLVGLLRRGLSAPAAYALLGEITGREALGQAIPKVDQRTLEQYTSQLQKVVSNRAVLEGLRKISSAPEAQRKELANDLVKRLQDPQFRQKEGIKFPTLRVTTRVFENDPRDPSGDSITLAIARRAQEQEEKRKKAMEDAQAKTTVCASVGYIVCISAGGDVEVQAE